MLKNIRYEHILEVVEVYAHCENAANNNAREDDTSVSDVEAIERTVNQRKHFKKRIIDSVDESGIDVGEQYGWVLDHNFERFYQGIDS